MPVTITRAHRDALYEELPTELTGLEDVYLALSNGDGELARDLWRRFDAELRLLDQLGWAPVEPIEEFAIDLPRDVLIRAVGRLQERAEQALDAHVNAPREDLQIAQHAVHVLAACRGAIAQLTGERS
jgi:hypothetical protein